VPNRLLLRPTIAPMTAAGIPRARIVTLVATGRHHPNAGEELARLIGDPWVLADVRVENHVAMRDDDHADLGTTPGRGVPIRLDRRLVEADLRIATGLVALHVMAGYSGGLLGRAQGRGAGHRASHDDPHLPRGARHGRPARGAVRPRP
jgi:nickel-dependent lactate racemase